MQVNFSYTRDFTANRLKFSEFFNFTRRDPQLYGAKFVFQICRVIKNYVKWKALNYIPILLYSFLFLSFGRGKEKKGGGLPTVCLQLLACEAETSTPTAREMLLRYAQVYLALSRRNF